jgi:hypothetical protein
MRKIHTHRRWRWMVAALAALAITAGIGLCQIQPSGTKAGLIQFDVISELNMLTPSGPAYPNRVVFARYWVCKDYYAVCTFWMEPHPGIWNMGATIFFSDDTGFRIEDEDSSEFIPVNTTYPKPLGARGPFPGGTMLRSRSLFVAETRFAEVEAASRRVYVNDLEPVKSQKPDADGIIDVNVPEQHGGGTRKLAHLKVRAQDDRIESMELFDDQQQQLGRMRYEYERDGSTPQITKLIADWPARPVKLAIDVNATTSSKSGKRKIDMVAEIDYVSHKGGRTSTVTYRNVAIGSKALRLPVQVEVRRSDDKRLIRSARLINFKEVDLDKAGVWRAAKAFGSFSREDKALAQLVQEYLAEPPRKRKPLQVDPNDVAFVKRLIAKYPVPEVAKPPEELVKPHRLMHGPLDHDPEVAMQQIQTWEEARRQERAERQEQMKAWREQVAKTPKPKRMTVEPGDAGAIRERIARYEEMLARPMTEQEKTIYHARGWLQRTIHRTEDEREIEKLRHQLQHILSYHHAPRPPEKKPKAMEPDDLKLICQLQDHYKELAAKQDRGLGEQLKALDALTRLDRILGNYEAFEEHTTRYLQTVRDAGLVAMHMVGGYKKIEKLMEAGQYDKANEVMKPWADKSAADHDPDTIFRFASMKARGPALSWASVQVLDRLLKRPGLSRVQRYEALALRAIHLDEIDRFLADPEAGDNESGGVDQWILSTTTRAGISKLVEPAVRQAVSAWGALGPARLSEAKPYSTENLPAQVKNMKEAPDATRLQETSARLNRIVSQRFEQKGTSPSPRETGQSAPTRKR